MKIKGSPMSKPTKIPQRYLTADQIKAACISSLRSTSSDKTMRFSIDSASYMRGIGTLVMGQVLSGTLTTGDSLVIYPKKLPTRVAEIQESGNQLKKAKTGDIVALLCEDLNADAVHPGDVGFLDAATPLVGIRVIAEMVFLRTPKDVGVGYSPVLYARSLKITATVAAIAAHLDPKTGMLLKSKPGKIKPGNLVVLELELPEKVVLEPHASFPELGCIALREMIDDMPQVIAVGVVLEIR
jgi:elongation factor 1 alpha-like protein